jgi:hypothetical protein
MLSLVVIIYPIYSVIKNLLERLVVATALGRPEHCCSRFNIQSCRCRHSKMFNLKQEIQPAFLFERLVELNGIEPLTPCLQSRCSPN